MSMTHEQVFKRLMAWQHLRLGACWIELRADQSWCVGTDREGLVDVHDDLHYAIDHFLTLVAHEEMKESNRLYFLSEEEEEQK